jgi:signal transduction histidine kinase
MFRGAVAHPSRRQVVAVLSILLPGTVLGYVGARALADRSTTLRTTYTATTALVRDRLAADLSHLESDLALELVRPGTTLDDPAVATTWLRSLAAATPWLADPFLLRVDGGVLTSELSVDWSRRGSPSAGAAANPLDRLPVLAAAIGEAEAAEFVAGHLDRALAMYRQALESATSDAARGLVLMRIGRTLFKLRRVEEGIAAYRTVLDLSPAAVDPHGRPYAVNALLEIADGLDALGRSAEKAGYQRQLLQLVVDHPWDSEEGYGYYLARALESAPPPPGALRTRTSELTRAAVTIQWIHHEVRPHVVIGVNDRSRTGRTAARVVVPRDDQPVLIGHLLLPEIAGSRSATVLGYRIRSDHVGGAMLADVLKTVDLGDEVRIELVGAQGRPASPMAQSGHTPMALADLDAVLPGWSVGLFDRDGRSLDQLVRRERWVSGSLIVGMVVVLIAGVTVTMRASAREAELSRLKTEFVSNVSHELKTPLALIRMFGETLESGLVTDEAKRQEFYAIIRRESDRLTHLINNVLDVARIDAGTKQYTLAETDVVALAGEAVDAYRPFLERLGFSVETALPESPVFVPLDRDAIAQALVNLFQNAIKYSGEEKKVSVSVGVCDSLVRVSVADRGVGIRAEDLPRIFEKHYRATADTAAGSPGSGLGLAIVKHAVEAHGGRVEVESTPGHGSTFTLVVPIRDARR